MGTHREGAAFDFGADRSRDPDHDEQVMRPAIVGKRELSAFVEVEDLSANIRVLPFGKHVEGCADPGGHPLLRQAARMNMSPSGSPLRGSDPANVLVFSGEHPPERSEEG